MTPIAILVSRTLGLLPHLPLVVLLRTLGLLCCRGGHIICSCPLPRALAALQPCPQPLGCPLVAGSRDGCGNLLLRRCRRGPRRHLGGLRWCWLHRGLHKLHLQASCQRCCSRRPRRLRNVPRLLRCLRQQHGSPRRQAGRGDRQLPLLMPGSRGLLRMQVEWAHDCRLPLLQRRQGCRLLMRRSCKWLRRLLRLR